MREKVVQWPIPIQAEGTRRDLCRSFLRKTGAMDMLGADKMLL